VQGLRVNMKDIPLKVKDCLLKVKALLRFPPVKAFPLSEAERKELIRAAKTAAFSVGNSWAFARRIRY